MGTETIDYKYNLLFVGLILVKLNNPLMGTETPFSSTALSFLYSLPG